MDQITITFPSGNTVTVGAPHVGSADPTRAAARRRGACKHIGAAVDVQTTCSGSVNQSSVWECELHGECAPLAEILYDKPGVVLCKLCGDWTAAPEPGLARLGLDFISAVAKWVKARMPTRDQRRVNELLKLCNSCPFIVRGAGSDICGKCGCPVNARVDDPTKNKLAMATEVCPAGFWK